MDYQLTQTGEQVQNILDAAPTTEQNLQSEITRSTEKDQELETAIGNEVTRAEGAEGELQTAIGNEKTRAEGAEAELQTAIGNEVTRAEGVEGGLRTDVDAINAKIPAQASSENKLATEGFVNSSVATATADFKGTYNSLEALQTAVQDANANDYAFVSSTDAAGNTVYNRYKYVTGTGWVFEYALNNSSFTTAQWAAINSAITAALVAKLMGLPTAASLTEQLNEIITSVANEKTRAEGAEGVLRTSIADNATAINTEKTRAQGVEGTLTTGLNNEILNRQAADTGLQQNISAEATLRTNADNALQQLINTINALIPSQASSSNQLADKAFVNSSIATNTADFKGTYNSLQELEQTVTTANANDYAFVISTDASGNTVYNRYKYVDGTGWVFEYALNNSSFTAAQWSAINSGITAALVAKLSGLPTVDALNAMFAEITGKIPSAASSTNKLVDYAQMVAALATKQNTLTFDNTPTPDSQNPVKSGGIYTAIQNLVVAIGELSVSKQDALTFDEYPAAGSDNPVKSKGIYAKLLEKQPNLVPGENLDTYPVAGSANPITSGAVKNALDLEVSDRNAAIAVETSRAEAAEAAMETDIETLRQLYNALQQSAPQVIEPSDTWPVANPSRTVIYRVIDRVNTPPEYYSDYMWNGTSMVEMAQYNNAIDDVPTPGSQNLVKSGGVASHIVFDISEANAVGSTLATYDDLTAALGVNGANVPESIRKGGMSIKFVLTSDNKYVQYRFMLSTFTITQFTNVANWQGVDDKLIPDSDNIPKIGIVYEEIKRAQQENTVFFPNVKVNILPSLCTNPGYINSNGQPTTDNKNYRYSDPIAVNKDDNIYMTGIGTDIPYFVYCQQDGTFISNSKNSTGVDSVYEHTFENDAYIIINGRFGDSNNPVSVSGIIYNGLTIPELTNKVALLYNGLNNNTYKFVAVRGAVYNKVRDGVEVTLNTLFVYRILDSSVTTINDSVTYTLNSAERFLVLTEENVLATRINSSAVRSDDLVLLYFDDNVASKDIMGGALFGNYIDSKFNSENAKISSEVSDVKGDVYKIYQENNTFFPTIIEHLVPSICVNKGHFISSNGTIGSNSNYGYSNPIAVSPGDRITISGVGISMPYFVYCQQDGTFISGSPNSTGVNSKYELIFNENKYIKINGRIKDDGQGLVGGLIYNGLTIQDLNNKILATNGVINYNVYKYVATRGAVYTKRADSIDVTLNTLFVYKVFENTVTTISSPITISMNSAHRFLVLTQNDALDTRINSSAVLSTDFILLYFDDNSANKDIVGGALYPDYIKALENQKIAKLNTDLDNFISDSQKMIPSNLGQVNCVRKAYQMASVKWTPKNGNIPYNSGNFPANTEQTGMIYSSAKEYNQFAFEDISLETFMTAVNNPRSVLYTENISAANSRSAIGRTYCGVNCAAYYGSVCSGLLTFAYGLPVNVTTYEFRTWDKMEEIEDQTPYGLQIGDAIWQSGHIQLCTGVTRNKYGIITNIEVVENAAATTKIKNYTVASLQEYIDNNNCVLLRYKELYKNRSYVPLTDFVAVEDETLGSYSYNDDICPNYGNKSCYNEGDNVVLNLRSDYASAGFTTLEVYKDDTLLISRSISGQDETLTGLAYGDYKARITGSTNSEYCNFKVVNASVVKDGTSFTFSSSNATPLYYEFCDLQGRRSYAIVGLSTHTFTDAEITAGEATPSGSVVSTGDYHYLKVHFQTDYGRVIKVIDWNV